MTNTTHTAAQEAIESADAYLSNAVLPTYSELLDMLRRTQQMVSDYSHTLQRTGARADALAAEAEALLSRHDRTMAGDFR